MVESRNEIRIQGARRLQDMSNQLKEIGEDALRRELRQAIRDGARVMTDDMKRTVKTLPVKGTPGGGPRQRGGWGLRRLSARATGTTFRTTRVPFVRVRCDALGRFPGRQETLPKYLDGEIKPYHRWRHPVFFPGPKGVIAVTPRNRIVQQENHRWFFVTARRNRDQVRQQILGAMVDIAERATR